MLSWSRHAFGVRFAAATTVLWPGQAQPGMHYLERAGKRPFRSSAIWAWFSPKRPENCYLNFLRISV